MKSFLEFGQQITEEVLDEVLSKDAKAGEWIDDFVKSDNPKFAGKSKDKRKEMALAAYYAKQRNEEVELDEEGLKDACWKGYEAIGTKKKNGKEVPNCVPVKESMDKMFKHVHKDVSGPKLAHKQAMDVVKNNQGKVRHISDTHSEVDFPGGKSAVFKTSKEGDKVVTHIAHHNTYSEEVEQIDELSKGTLGSYVNKSFAQGNELHQDLSYMRGDKATDAERKAVRDKISKRNLGVIKANKKLKEENQMISYSEFMAKLDESNASERAAEILAAKRAERLDKYDFSKEKQKPVSAVKQVKGRSYGADKPDNEDDEDENKKSSEPEVKRGRGRPRKQK